MNEHFLAALKKTLGHEGVYSADKLDPGGETFMGISRVYWPGWPGWPVIDAWDKKGDPPDLSKEVEEFYYLNFWCRFQGDKVAAIAPAVAEEIFDSAVNLDVPDAVKFFQVALNMQNRNKTLRDDLPVDGKLGKGTLEYFRWYMQSRHSMDPATNEEILLACMNGEQYIHYKANPRHEWYRGWFRRV